jgi:hypothetical protein
MVRTVQSSAGYEASSAPAFASLLTLLALGCSGGPEGGESPGRAGGTVSAEAARAGSTLGSSSPRSPGWLVEAPLYTLDQAERGAEVFLEICSTCHTPLDFTRSEFRAVWAGTTVYELFRWISTAMPKDAPGRLDPEQYAAVFSFILRENGLPAGTDELGADLEALGRHRLVLPPHSGTE